MRKMKSHFPGANEWMWDYCVFLGPFTDSNGTNWDLGIHIDSDRYDFNVSGAIVYGNEPGDYYSPELQNMRYPPKDYRPAEAYFETFNRAVRAGYISSSLPLFLY